MAVVAAQLAFAQCLFDGCIASFDAEKQRRPYHRNCGCALHGCARTGTRDVSCRCAKLPCPLRPGACRRGRLAVANPASSLSSTGGSWSCVGVGAMHGPGNGHVGRRRVFVGVPGSKWLRGWLGVLFVSILPGTSSHGKLHLIPMLLNYRL